VTLGFYYHIPFAVGAGDELYTQGMLGVFLEGLAKEVEVLVLLCHTYKGEDEYLLRSKNIRLVDLGTKTPAWHRHIFHSKILRNIKNELDGLNVLLVRAPSPLAPFFNKHLSKDCLLRYYIVGSYKSSSHEMRAKTIREHLIKIYLKVNHQLFLYRLKDEVVFVNSLQLKNELEGVCASVINVPTTTLTDNDFFNRKDTCNGNIINILFTGRIDLQKGLMELLQAFVILCDEYSNLRLHLVGWEEGHEKTVERLLKKTSEDLRVQDKVVFHGRKKVGEELWQMYRMADIYCIPSYHEGFPRTIWEAMANGLPVIATRVGGIPNYLSTHYDSILIKPKSVDEIVEAIKNLISSKALRKQIIDNGYSLVKDNTIEYRVKELLSYLK
jgi:glycosyltransferase involved in cell wall biosynthesis